MLVIIDFHLHDEAVIEKGDRIFIFFGKK